MISLTCTNCQTTLSIDDAFAGGVCRCQHCGTIQTVPVRRKSNGAATPAAAESGAEDAHPSAAGTESRTATRAARAASPTPPAPAPNTRLKGFLIAAAVAIVVLIAVIIWMTTTRGA
jgi:hypothetical protein